MCKFPDICDVFPQVPETLYKRAGQNIQVYIFSLMSLIVYLANNAKTGYQDFLIRMYLIFCNFAPLHSIVLMYLRGASARRAEIDRESAGRRYARAKSIDSMIF